MQQCRGHIDTSGCLDGSGKNWYTMAPLPEACSLEGYGEIKVFAKNNLPYQEREDG